MTTQEEIQAIEQRVKVLSLPLSFLLGRAKVPPSTWSRWKSGAQGPTKKKWDALTSALEDLERRLA